MKMARVCLIFLVLILSGYDEAISQQQENDGFKTVQVVSVENFLVGKNTEKNQNDAAKEINDEMSTGKQTEIFEKHKYIALTFDDGPHPVYTPKILDLLEFYNVPATFFILGQRVRGNETILQRIVKNGSEIGNHTWNHMDLRHLSSKIIEKEIRMSQQIIAAVTGHKAKLFRPPYGAYNAFAKKAVRMPFILWTVDTLDWKYRDAGVITKRVLRETKDGSVILLHDIHASTLEAVKIIIPKLKESGFIFVTMSELENLK